MPKTEPFDTLTDRYDGWFVRHESVYLAELRAVRALLPEGGRILEVGIGTGRFAVPLGVTEGVDPSAPARAMARERGISVHAGVAEALPFPDGVFDAVLMITTLCFVDDVYLALREARRTLRPGGVLVLSIVDRDGPMGADYVAKARSNPFYKDAAFFGAAELLELLLAAGFCDLRAAQTLFAPPDAVSPEEPVLDGHGAGGFAVLRGTKPISPDPRA
ncbi:MAG: class I SAM-dependent methyltransferase [Deltaproteobacteria bacterium]|nr:class I SAM-dependent methyltransferase [Deltaproteobacteria bacterium]